MAETLIRNADFLLTMNDARDERRGADILIRDGIVAAIGSGLRSVGDVIEARLSELLPHAFGRANLE